MQLPELKGNISVDGFFIFAACDEHYFDDFAPALINSVQKNTGQAIHLHIFNPRPDQLDFCRVKSISYTYEFVSLDLFSSAANRWNVEYSNEPLSSQKLRTLTAMSKGKDVSIQDRMRKTYYACARFIRLDTLTKNNDKFLAIDVDAVVRKPIQSLSDKNFFIHHISGKKARFLAGGLYSPGGAKNFLQEYSKELQSYIVKDYIYWGLDQDILDLIVPKYEWGQLPADMIDWNMTPQGTIWTAKGTRKDLAVFVNEKQKYIS